MSAAAAGVVRAVRDDTDPPLPRGDELHDAAPGPLREGLIPALQAASATARVEESPAMQMLYNSEHFAVVQFDVPGFATDDAREGGSARGGYEIVDKLARREIFIDGALAQRFRAGVEALIEREPSVEAIDDFIAGYTQLAQQPVVLH